MEAYELVKKLEQYAEVILDFKAWNYTRIWEGNDIRPKTLSALNDSHCCAVFIYAHAERRSGYLPAEFICTLRKGKIEL